MKNEEYGKRTFLIHNSSFIILFVRVVILSAFLSPFRSGAEACAEEIPLTLADRYDFTIVTARLSRGLSRHDMLRGKIPIVRIGLGIPLDKWLFPFLAPFAARRLRPAIIHAVLETFAGLALLFCRWLVPEAKRVLTLQTVNRSLLKGPIVASPHAVTAISGALKRCAEGLGRHNVIVIPNGIPLATIHAACMRKTKVPGRILFVGRLEPMKGVDTLLEAFARIAPEFPHVHLRIVGSGSLRSRLETRSSQPISQGRVIFVGHTSPPTVYDEFAAAEIFCGLSRSEALGNVFLEAQAAGCAVIGTRVGGIPEIIEDGRTGLLVPPDDSATAADALAQLLRDDALRGRLATAGKERAARYDWEAIAPQYIHVYDEALR